MFVHVQDHNIFYPMEGAHFNAHSLCYRIRPTADYCQTYDKHDSSQILKCLSSTCDTSPTSKNILRKK